jgi:hypothetical protein
MTDVRKGPVLAIILGGSLGLAVLVSVYAAAGGTDDLAQGAAAALAVGTALLGLVLLVVIGLIVRPSRPSAARLRAVAA